jgi:hypothetical protein
VTRPSAAKAPALSAALRTRSRGDLAESLVPVAGELAFTVRTEGAAAIGAWLDRHGLREGATVTAETRALLVVLAARVDIDATGEDQLAWVTWDEAGEPLDGTIPLLPCVPAGRPGGEPEPAGDEMTLLRAAHAEVTRLCRAGDPVPADLRAADGRYRSLLRKQGTGAEAGQAAGHVAA